MRVAVICSVSVIALSVASQVNAQDASAPAAAPAPAASTAPAAVPAAPPSGITGDIIVTARRRAESITSVPVSITALNGAGLASKGILRVDDLQRSTPGFKAQPTAGRRTNSQYMLRGITTIESLITEDSAVGVYVNDVYRARATGTNQSFYDIDNVQVLYGPQGTLFGRNSSAGAILINTNKPTNHFEGNIEAGYGNYNAYQITGAINIPIIDDKLAVRIAGQRQKRDGYGENVTTGQKLSNTNTYAGRVSVDFKPTETIDNLTVASAFVANEAGTLNVLYAYAPNGPFGSIVSAAAANQAQLGPYKVADDPTLLDYRNSNPSYAVGTTAPTATPTPDSYERTRNYAVSNITTANLTDGLVFKNIFGFNYVKLNALTDLDATPVKLIDTYYGSTDRQISDEVQLQGHSSKFDWVVGGLFFRERGQDIQNSVQGIAAKTFQNLIGINTSYAVFAQGTYKILPKLSLTAGGRYTIDKREAKYLDPRTVTAASNSCSLPAPYSTDCFLKLNKTFKEPTYTVSLDYKPTSQTLIYVAHRRGYRSGGFNARVSLTAPTVVNQSLIPFEPEIVKDVEVGFKGNFKLPNGGGVRTSIALYDSWYTNIQKQSTILTGFASPATTTVIVSASDAETKGLEATLGVSPVRGFDIDGFFGYVDGHYKNFHTTVPGTTTAEVLHSIPFFGSKVTAGVTVSLTPIDTPEFGSITWSTSFSYRSHFDQENTIPFLDPGPGSTPPAFNTFNPGQTGPASRVPGQENVNVNLDWNNIKGTGLSASLWMTNAFNQVHYLGATSILATALAVTPMTVGEPRMYGFTLKYKF